MKLPRSADFEHLQFAESIVMVQGPRARKVMEPMLILQHAYDLGGLPFGRLRPLTGFALWPASPSGRLRPWGGSAHWPAPPLDRRRLLAGTYALSAIRGMGLYYEAPVLICRTPRCRAITTIHVAAKSVHL